MRARDMSAEACNLLESIMFPKVSLPSINPAGVPLCIRVFDGTKVRLGESLSDVPAVATRYVPITQFISAQYRKPHGMQREGQRGANSEKSLMFDAPPVFLDADFEAVGELYGNDGAVTQSSTASMSRGKTNNGCHYVGGVRRQGRAGMHLVGGKNAEYAYDVDSEEEADETDIDALLASGVQPRRQQKSVRFNVGDGGNVPRSRPHDAERRRSNSQAALGSTAKDGLTVQNHHVINIELDALNVVAVDSGAVEMEWRESQRLARGIRQRRLAKEAAKRGGLEDDYTASTAATAKRTTNAVHSASIPQLSKIHPNFYALSLFHGNMASFSFTGSARLKHAMLLKAFVRVAPVLRRNQRREGRRQQVVNLVQQLSDSNLLEPFRSMYAERYISRLYVYNGYSLVPPDSLFAPLSAPKLRPYLAVKNGELASHMNDTRPRAKVATDFEPSFFEVFELLTEFPSNARMSVSVMSHSDVIHSMDREVGSVTLDSEDLILVSIASRANLPGWGLEGPYAVRALANGENGLQEDFHGDDADHDDGIGGAANDSLCGRTVLRNGGGIIGRTEFFPLYVTGRVESRGGLTMRLDVLTELQARRQRAEELVPPIPSQYELRVVLWNTRQVAFPDNKRLADDVNQRVSISYDAEGGSEDATIKMTDVAWGAAHGSAEWNHRFIFKAELPCAMPRLQLALMHSSVVYGGELLGEVLLNMQPFFERAMRDRKSVTHDQQRWVEFSHPNFPGTRVGEALVELWLYTQLEAEKKPAGEAQSEPNEDPFLPAPFRNPPPWAVGSRALDWLEGRKRLLLCLLCLVIFLPILLPLILTVYKSAVFK